jgi:hypothetical protein
VSNTVRFCEGCPFANGVQEGETVTNGFTMTQPNPGFEVYVQNERGNETEHIRVQTPLGETRPDMPGQVADYLEKSTRACSGPVGERCKRLGGLLGSKLVRRCGAFPDQDSDDIRVGLQ